MIDQLGNGLLLGIIISVASVALSLLYGVTRIVNFAHGEIIALGAIVTLFLSGPNPVCVSNAVTQIDTFLRYHFLNFRLLDRASIQQTVV